MKWNSLSLCPLIVLFSSPVLPQALAHWLLLHSEDNLTTYFIDKSRRQHINLNCYFLPSLTNLWSGCTSHPWTARIAPAPGQANLFLTQEGILPPHVCLYILKLCPSTDSFPITYTYINVSCTLHTKRETKQPMIKAIPNKTHLSLLLHCPVPACDSTSLVLATRKADSVFSPHCPLIASTTWVLNSQSWPSPQPIRGRRPPVVLSPSSSSAFPQSSFLEPLVPCVHERS